MAPAMSRALLGAALVAPGLGFVLPQSSSGRQALRAPAQGATSSGPERASSYSVKQACGLAGLAAAAGVAALAQKKRRSACASGPVKEVNVMRFTDDYWEPEYYGPPPRGYFDGGKVPVPGSEKYLQTLVGADVETGGVPWDPWGLSKLYDRNFDFNGSMSWDHVQWHREAELKHGRIAMLAFVGMVVQSFTQITPPYPAEPDWTKALPLCYADKTASIGIVQISVFIMILEGHFFPFDARIGSMDREPGDLGFDPLKLSKAPNFDLKSMQLKELKNGRLAMIGVAAMFASKYIPGSVPFSLGALPRPAEAVSAPAMCGKTRPEVSPANTSSKTQARYTTQVILPALAWLKSGVKSKDLAPTQLKSVQIGGQDVLLGKDESGKIFCVANLCPHIGTPMSEGADVIGDVIICPLHGSSFKVTTGELIDWCPSPPIIGPLTGFVIEKKNLLVFDVREGGLFGGGELEVLIDVNAKRAYEANYWKGLLDAQGKDDGTYY